MITRNALVRCLIAAFFLCEEIISDNVSPENETDASRAILRRPIWVGVQVDDVSNFNERIMRFSVMMTMFYIYMANCNSLRKPLYPYVRLPAGDDVVERSHNEWFYKPDTLFEEAVNVHVVPSMERLEYTYRHPGYTIGENCVHVMKTKLNATIACLMNFLYFPMDTQTCTVTIRSYAHPKHILNYYWTADDLLLFNNRLRVPEYHVTFSKTDQVPSTQSYDTTGEAYARLRIIIRFRRRIQRHLVDTFVPTAFLVVLSWLSFWLGTSKTHPRVVLCSVVLVAVLQHLTAAREGLPPSRTWTGLDIWTILCLGFVSSSIVEVTFVCYCSQPAVHGGRSTKPNTRAQLRVSRFEEATLGISGRSQEPETKRRLSRLEHDIGGRQMAILGTAERTDKFCRVAFPVAFFVSNIIYWSWLYSNQAK